MPSCKRRASHAENNGPLPIHSSSARLISAGYIYCSLQLINKSPPVSTNMDTSIHLSMYLFRLLFIFEINHPVPHSSCSISCCCCKKFDLSLPHSQIIIISIINEEKFFTNKAKVPKKANSEPHGVSQKAKTGVGERRLYFNDYRAENKGAQNSASFLLDTTGRSWKP